VKSPVCVICAAWEGVLGCEACNLTARRKAKLWGKEAWIAANGARR